MTPTEAEQHMVEWSTGESQAPPFAVSLAEATRDKGQGISVGFAYHESTGWMVLANQGKGPLIIYQEIPVEIKPDAMPPEAISALIAYSVLLSSPSYVDDLLSQAPGRTPTWDLSAIMLYLQEYQPRMIEILNAPPEHRQAFLIKLVVDIRAYIPKPPTYTTIDTGPPGEEYPADPNGHTSPFLDGSIERSGL